MGLFFVIVYSLWFSSYLIRKGAFRLLYSKSSMNPKSTDKVDDSRQCYMDKNNIKYMVCDWLQKVQWIKNPDIWWLYVRWDISLLLKPLISIVWPRKMSQYGSRVLGNLFSEMKFYDIATVSWWAQWTDELVHILSLSYAIPTIVVLWWWIWWYKNTWKVHFLQKIVDQWWLIISEYTIFESPKKYTFPQRNRIIAWLGDIIFLPEAGLASGSLITVDRGIEYEKMIYAPMQDIFLPTSAGTNEYISQWKITPLASLQWFLDTHFSKKQWIVDNTERLPLNILPITAQKNLIDESMRELGL